MTDAVAVRQIACTQCGAPLELHGGQRVQSLNCAYCGAVLDARKDYRVLFQYQNREKPFSPLQLGMQGRIKGVEFTLIGMLQYVSEDQYKWLDYQLYSPTHGYAWLTYNRGHYVFTRRTRDLPKPSSLRRDLPPRTRIYLGKETFLIYESYQARVAYVEGELTWIAREGDAIEVLEAINPPRVLSYVNTEAELEYEISEYLSPQFIHDSFELPGEVEIARGIHPAQPYPHQEFTDNLLSDLKLYLWFAAIAIFISLLSGVTSGYFILLLVLFGGIGFYTLMLRYSFEQQRWAEVVEDD